jgi:hypothetical protein
VPIVVGGVYSVRPDDSYGVAKVLAVHEETVHVRLYANRYPQRPSTVDRSLLNVTTEQSASARRAQPEASESKGTPHLPLARRTFEAWRPILIATVPLEADELEAFRTWQERHRSAAG